MQSTAEKHPEQTKFSSPSVIPGEAEGSYRHAAQDDIAQPDRLAAAEFFARELNESRLWKIRISYQKRWTKHRRTQKSLEIQRTRPHLARTANNNARVRRDDVEDILMKRALKKHGAFLRAVSTLCRLRKTGHPLTPAFTLYCRALGAEATAELETARAFISRVTSQGGGLTKSA